MRLRNRRKERNKRKSLYYSIYFRSFRLSRNLSSHSLLRILRFIIYNITTSQAEVLQFLLQALSMHAYSFGCARYISIRFIQDAFNIRALKFAPSLAEISRIGDI